MKLTAALLHFALMLLANAMVAAPPTIISFPSNVSIEQGQPLVLTVAAYGTLPLTYTWMKDGATVKSSISPSYTVPYASLSDSGSYSVEVTNTEGSVTTLLASSVAPSEAFTLFIKADGSLWGMGLNSSGQLGTNDKLSTASPKAIATGANAVAAGIWHSLFIKDDGYLWSMGGNSSGQLVDGTKVAERTAPSRAVRGVQQMTAGIGFTSYLTLTGPVGGNNASLSAGSLIGIRQIAAGGDHVLFVDKTNKLWGSGDNRSGQLGSVLRTSVSSPTLVAEDVTTVAGGTYSTFFITSDKKLWGLGLNQGGQLGDGTQVNRSTPALISSDVIRVAAGLGHAAFIKSDKSLWTIGANNSGQLGDGTNQNRLAPVKIADNVGIVACGRNNTFFVKSDGTLYATGSNSDGQLGLGNANNTNSPAIVSTGVKLQIQASATVSVTAASITLKGATPSVNVQVGHTVFPPLLELRYSDNRTFPAPPVWEIEDTAIASMRADGTVLGLKIGTTQLLAKINGQTIARIPLSVTVNVLGSSVTRIEVQTAPSSLIISHSADLICKVYLSDGRVLDNPAGVALSVSDGKLTIAGTKIIGARSGAARLLISAGNTSVEIALNVVSYEKIAAIDEFLATPAKGSGLQVPVVIINYLPTKNGIDIDTERAPTYWDLSPVTIARIKEEIIDKMKLTKFGLEEGSKFRGFNDASALPYVGIQVVGYYNFYEVPYQKRPGDPTLVSQVDYSTVFATIGMEDLVNTTGVKDVWLNLRPISPEYPVVKSNNIPAEFFINAWESNMSSPTGDISNSDRYEGDLPIYKKTYVVYGNNLHRSQSENLHNIGHQIENQLGYLDYRSGDAIDQIFWKYFSAHPFTGNPGKRVGDVHFPPNALADYDWGNTAPVLSDIEDWKPAGGATKSINASRWIDIRYAIPRPTTFSFDERDSQYKWLLFWFQSIPGKTLLIPYQTGYISNWWDIFYNWDSTLAQNGKLWTLTSGISAPTFTTQPLSQTVTAGTSVTFTAAASGNPTPTYQWRKDAVNISGATSSTFTIASVVAGDAASYTVVATNSVSSVTSSAATLTVTAALAAPAFTTQPSSATVIAGGAATFTTAASGNPTPTYQWQKGGVNISGATSATYTIASTVLGDAGSYTVNATNSAGSVTSSAATLTVNTVPSITTQPLSQTITAGNSVTFTAAASGNPTPTYQWQKGGVNISGATSATYTIASTVLGDAGNYTVIVTNSVSSVTSSAVILAVNISPAITTQPSSQTVTSGNSVTLSVVASGNPTPTYQWQKSGVNISGATSATYTIASTVLGDAGNYTAVATNSLGSATSSTVTLTVNLAVPIIPTAQIVVTGRNAILRITANTIGTIRWQVSTDNGATFSDLTDNATYRGTSAAALEIFEATSLLNKNRYRYQVTLSGQTVASTATTLNVKPAYLLMPVGLKIDTSNNLYVTDAAAQVVVKITSNFTISSLAGATLAMGATDGSGALARFNEPSGIYVKEDGSILIADTSNSSIRKISTTGLVTTLAGSSGNLGSTDGNGSVARFNAPVDIVRDISGNYVITDSVNHVIRLMSESGAVATLSGKIAGFAGSIDGVASVAMFNLPTGIAVRTDSGPTIYTSGVTAGLGAIFIADTGSHIIRVVSPTGLVGTYLGAANISGSANGFTFNARFKNPTGLVTDSLGNLYIADTGNHTIRKATTLGAVTTFAGTPTVSGLIDGSGNSALFNSPEGLAVDLNNNIYVADTGNAAIRKITPAGVVSTLPIVGEIPTITIQPASLIVTAGNSASFRVVADSDGSLSYQWKKDGSDIAGAAAAIYTISSTATTSAGSYTVVVTNAAGTVTSAAATLTVNVLPAITTQPSSQTVTAGNSVTFSVVATGTPTPTYQWRKDGAAISGATAASYAISSLVSGDAGSYTVVVSNFLGSVTSSAATLTVNAAPAPAPTPAPSSGGGGGGGAVSPWFIGALGLLLLARRTHRRE